MGQRMEDGLKNKYYENVGMFSYNYNNFFISQIEEDEN